MAASLTIAGMSTGPAHIDADRGSLGISLAGLDDFQHRSRKLALEPASTALGPNTNAARKAPRHGDRYRMLRFFTLSRSAQPDLREEQFHSWSTTWHSSARRRSGVVPERSGRPQFRRQFGIRGPLGFIDKRVGQH